MHSYGGSKKIYESFEKIYPNFYYTVSMNITKKPEILEFINPDKLLLETDAPHQYNE